MVLYWSKSALLSQFAGVCRSSSVADRWVRRRNSAQEISYSGRIASYCDAWMDVPASRSRCHGSRVSGQVSAHDASEPSRTTLYKTPVIRSPDRLVPRYGTSSASVRPLSAKLKAWSSSACAPYLGLRLRWITSPQSSGSFTCGDAYGAGGRDISERFPSHDSSLQQHRPSLCRFRHHFSATCGRRNWLREPSRNCCKRRRQWSLVAHVHASNAHDHIPCPICRDRNGHGFRSFHDEPRPTDYRAARSAAHRDQPVHRKRWSDTGRHTHRVCNGLGQRNDNSFIWSGNLRGRRCSGYRRAGPGHQCHLGRGASHACANRVHRGTRCGCYHWQPEPHPECGICGESCCPAARRQRRRTVYRDHGTARGSVRGGF